MPEIPPTVTIPTEVTIPTDALIEALAELYSRASRLIILNGRSDNAAAGDLDAIAGKLTQAAFGHSYGTNSELDELVDRRANELTAQWVLGLAADVAEHEGALISA